MPEWSNGAVSKTLGKFYNPSFSSLFVSLLTNQQSALMRIAGSRHRKSEVKTLGRGYPDTLPVFRMPASKYWNDNVIVPHEWLDSGKPNLN